MLFNKTHIYSWDESVYIGNAKAMYSFGHEGLWEPIRPPVLSFILGFFWKIGFSNSAFDLIEILFAVALILLTYKIAEKIFGIRIAVLASVIVAMYPFFVNQYRLVMTDIVAAVFLLAFFYSFISARYFRAGFYASLAILSKFPNILVLLVVVMFMLIALIFYNINILKTGIRIMIFLVGFSFLIVPYLLLNMYLYHDQTSNIFVAAVDPFILASTAQNNPAEYQSPMFYLNGFYNNHPILLLGFLSIISFIIILIGMLYKGVKKDDELHINRLYYGYCLMTFFIIYFTYFSFIINRQLRFVNLFLAPLAIFSAYLFVTVYDYCYKRYNINFVKLTFFIILLLLFINPFNKILLDYHDLAEEETNVVDVYRYQFNTTKPVLTNIPHNAAYTDYKFIYYYEGLNVSIKQYNEGLEKVDYIVYYDNFFDCVGNKECERYNTELKELVFKNKLVYNLTYHNGNYYIFKKV